MKKIILLSIFSLIIPKGYSQCADCHNGGHFGNNKKVGRALPPDSSGGLALSYLQQNVCGLNWQQTSVLTTTRYSPPGTGIPCTVPLTFDSCTNIDSVLTAFLYFNGSYQTAYAANPASVSITNPAAQVFIYLADSIGTGPSKCWGETGTIAYRVNVTSCIKGGGNYIVDLSGTGITAWAIDGTTLLVVYIDKSASYSGSIALYDGLYTNFTGSPDVQTFTGIDVCSATPTGQAFGILADMQNNISPTNTEVFNGSSGVFPNLFYNFCTVTTSLTAGQTMFKDSAYANDADDCYSWVLAGMYWQNTNCQVCTPQVTGTLPISVIPPIDTICQGDSVQLAASGANTYIWAPATGLSCNNCPNPKASPNATTVYTVTGFDGCNFGKDTVEIVVSPKATPSITPSNPQICTPDSIQLTVTGGANYVWKPSATLSCNTCSDPFASPTVTTTYTVVSGYNGCKDSAMVTVTVTATPTVSVVPQSPTICAGGSVRLTASGAVTYHWTPAGSLSCLSCSNPLATPTVTTVYTVVGSSGICTGTSTDTVFVVPAPIPAISPRSDSVCQGDTIQLSASGGGTYTWSNGKTTSTITVAPATTTTYTLKVSNGICTDSTTATIKITPKITATVKAVNDTVCPHGTTTITASGVGGPATYKWSNGATTSSITVSDTVTTVYTAEVYGLCDSLKVTKTVVVIPLPKPAIDGRVWKCKGQKDTLTVTSSINPTTYVWSNGKTSTSIVTGDINADSSFYVTAYNSLGCSVKDTFNVGVKPYPNANITYPPGCGVLETTITADASGTGPFTYKWNTGGTNDTIDVYITGSTTYTVTISNGCPVIRTITVVPEAPPLTACCNTNIFQGESTGLSADGNTIIKYLWSPDTALSCDTCANPIASPTVTTTYTVIGTDAEGCTSEQIITIVVELPCFNLVIPNVFTPTESGVLGLDNVFYIQTRNMDAWSLTIYDRWGKEMYKSSNPNEYWGGTTEGGAKASAGVYYYIINATCQNDTYKKDGFVQLIR